MNPELLSPLTEYESVVLQKLLTDTQCFSLQVHRNANEVSSLIKCEILMTL